MYQIKNLPDGRTEAEERRREGFVQSTVGPVGTKEEHRDRGTGAQPRVLCGALKHRQGMGPKNGTEEHLRGCWTNIVSTLLILGIRSLNALLAHSIAVNTSYRSSLGITNPGIQALIALDLVIRRK
jgi:hypothetical protein